MDGKIWPTQTPKWRPLGGFLPTSTTNVTGFIRNWGEAVPKILSFVVKMFMCCTGSFSVETGEGRAKKSKNVSASEIYYMAEKQCFRLSYNQKPRERGKRERKKSLSRRKERAREFKDLLFLLSGWSEAIKFQLHISQDFLVGPVSPAACLALLCFHLSNPVPC